MNYSPPNQVLALTENKQLPYQVVLDPDGSIAKNFGNIQLTPTSFLIDRKGTMVMQKVGKFDLAVIKELIKNL
jgi:peroxiredoxin